jgi:hypothetical protein
MAYKLNSIDLKQMLTLRLDGYSNRKTGRTLGLARNTINGYLELFMTYLSQNLLIRPIKNYESFSHLNSMIIDS